MAFCLQSSTTSRPFIPVMGTENIYRKSKQANESRYLGKHPTNIIVSTNQNMGWNVYFQPRDTATRIIKEYSNTQVTCKVTPIQNLFSMLVLRWRQERGATSSISQMAICPSYQRIIGMGEKAIPLLLEQLGQEQDDPDHWFWALQALTGEDPVNAGERGDMRKMAQAWLKWGSKSGYAW